MLAMKPTLALLLSNWCKTHFLGNKGEQNYTLALNLIPQLAVKYNTSGWYAWLAVCNDEIAIALTNGTGGQMRNVVYGGRSRKPPTFRWRMKASSRF